MVKVYLLTGKQLGDRDFNEISVAELQIEAESMSLEDFQHSFNISEVDARTTFIKFVAI